MSTSAAIVVPLLGTHCSKIAMGPGLAAGFQWPSGRARRSVGQHTVSSMSPSLAAPRARLATRPPGTRCSSTATGRTRRTVMNNAGWGQAAKAVRVKLDSSPPEEAPIKQAWRHKASARTASPFHGGPFSQGPGFQPATTAAGPWSWSKPTTGTFCSVPARSLSMLGCRESDLLPRYQAC
jgi:hypothetical protein